MKTYIFAALSTLTFLSTQAEAYECTFKEVPSTGTRYVMPIYRAKANFFFDKNIKEAYALTSWDLDVEKTRDCFNLGKEKYPQNKVIIPTVRAGDLEVKVMGSETTMPLNLYPLSNGHFSGSSNMIWIPYSSREKIESAIKNGERVIEILGDFRFKLTVMERKVLGAINCIEKSEEAGVLNLYKRLGEIKTILESRNPRESINQEEVMQDFLGSCVEFKNVESESLVGFDSAQRMNSKILKGDFPFQGNAAKETTEAMPTVGAQNAAIFDI